MKAALYDLKGTKKGDVEMPAAFNSAIREDIVAKYVEADKTWQAYSNHPEAGKHHSAAGIISHKRHDWKGQYGKGMSRVPRKIMWRRGVQFYFVGAEVSATRGGRRAHPPKGMRRIRKINAKEMKIAFNSAYAATAQSSYIAQRYARLAQAKIPVPLVIESKLQKAKTKDIIALLKKLCGEAFAVVLKQKQTRAGIGKLRGRSYKSNAGLLLVVGKDENLALSGVDVKRVSDVSISDLYPLGRLTVYTEKALEELK